jgi:hypothetical protein
MEYKRFGNKIVVRLDKGDEVVQSIKTICADNNITLGSITGIGAVNKVVIGLFETQTKHYHSQEFTGDMEITSLMGNISRMNGEVYLHLHANLGNIEFKTIGGHLNSAIISATGEMVIDIIDGEVSRGFSEEIGLNLIKF